MSTDLVISAFCKYAEDADVADYIYVVKLGGVVGLPDLLMAKPGSHMKDVMVTEAISLEEGENIDNAKEKFSWYRFGALPVTSSDDSIRGVVTYRDIMGLGSSVICMNDES